MLFINELDDGRNVRRQQTDNSIDVVNGDGPKK
jgi:hypothetical protein